MSVARSISRLILLACLVVCLWGTTGRATLLTLGHTTAEATQLDLGGQARIRGGIFKMPSDVNTYTLDTIGVYLDFAPDFGTTTWSIRTAVYLWRGSGNNATLVDTAAVRSFGSSTTSGWQGWEVVGFGNLYADSSYLICVWSNTSILDEVFLRYNSASTGDTIATKNLAVGAWPNPLTGTSLTNSGLLSIYAKYNGPEGLADTRPTSDSLNCPGTVIGSATGTVEGNIRMTLDTLPTGVNKQADAIWAYVDITTGGASSASKMKGVLYRGDNVYVGETTERTDNWEALGDGWRLFTFASPKPTMIGDSTYYFGIWAEANANTVINAALNTTGTHKYSNQALTYGTSPTPLVPSLLDASAYVSIILFYSTPSVSTVKGRRRKILQTSWIDWQLRPNYLVWESQKCFAGDDDAIAQ